MKRLLLQRQAINCVLPTQFYLCADTGFRGCCSIDACVNRGCPDAVSNLADTSTSGTRSTSTSTSTATSIIALLATSTRRSSLTTSSASTIESAQASASTASIASVESKHSNTGLIAGLTVAGLVIIILIIIIIALVLRHRKRRQAAASPTIVADNKEALPSANRNSIAKDFFARLSWARLSQQRDSLLKTSASPGPPAYEPEDHSDAGANIAALDGRPIYELPADRQESAPVELAANPTASHGLARDSHARSRTGSQGTEQDTATRRHTMSWADYGAERDEVGHLSGTLQESSSVRTNVAPTSR